VDSLTVESMEIPVLTRLLLLSTILPLKLKEETPFPASPELVI